MLSVSSVDNYLGKFTNSLMKVHFLLVDKEILAISSSQTIISEFSFILMHAIDYWMLGASDYPVSNCDFGAYTGLQLVLNNFVSSYVF